LYEFDSPFGTLIWYGNFLFFLIPIFFLIKEMRSKNIVFQIFIIFITLIIGQSIADILLIKFYGNIVEYNFFACLRFRWKGNILIYLSPFIFSAYRKKKEQKEDDILDK
jgi:hypothetical protein